MNDTITEQTDHQTQPGNASFSGASPATFAEQDIKAAYAKTRTGADFPRLIQDLKNLGIISYDHLLGSGSNVFHGQDGQSATLSNMGPSVSVCDRPDVALLKRHIAEHQRGLTNYPTLCGLAGQAGVAKWTSDLLAMTCTYFDKTGRPMPVELIPAGEYGK